MYSLEDLETQCNDLENFGAIISMLRFYASASHVSYVDRLASAISLNVIEKTLAEAVRELHTISSNAITVRKGRICRLVVEKEESEKNAKVERSRAYYRCDEELGGVLRCCDYEVLEDEYLSRQGNILVPIRTIPERMKLYSMFVEIEEVSPRMERLLNKVIACYLCPPLPSSKEIEMLIKCMKSGYRDLLQRIVASSLARPSR